MKKPSRFNEQASFKNIQKGYRIISIDFSKLSTATFKDTERKCKKVYLE